MRFVENGPSLPAHLLEEQSQGNVIFFCGAGISVPAGLDSFAKLTDRIITNLDASKARLALSEGQSFDLVFNALVREFGREEIDSQIYDALHLDKPRTLKRHRDILTLSQGPGGNAQIVTTNFDRLFERARKSLRPIIPPGLPDIELNQPIRGVVYLHGRLADPSDADEIPSYVISSADFGRAYLAEGWATRFVKSLREKYTIVLLGYSADDPPVRYLLEGLNVRDGVTYQSPIYVFTDYAGDEAEEIWQDRGVTPICYSPDKTHAALWSTISAWAKAARTPDRWSAHVLDLAQCSPASLKPFERGQVVQFVSTKKGAKAFADANPSPRAEWLCVFDPHVRFLRPRKAFWEEGAAEVDPQDFYGLDGDPDRPAPSDNRLVPEGARNPLAWQKGDGSQSERAALQGWSKLWHNPLPDRLHHLARWFGASCHEPAAIWWAAGYRRLNPHIHWFVSTRLRDRHGADMAENARKIWLLHLEALDLSPDDDRSDRWFEFEGLLKKSGWSPPVARFLERCVSPYVELTRPQFAAPMPPLDDWSKLRLRDVADLKVKSLDRHNYDVNLPSDALAQVLKILRTSLERTSELLDEIEDFSWRPPTLLPEADDDAYFGKKAQTFIWFKSLFEEVVRQGADQARREFLAWPTNEKRIFPKLRLWAAANSQLAELDEVLELLTSLDQKILWDPYNQREFLHLLKSRWTEFSVRQRRAIERLLLAGPPRWAQEKPSAFRQRRAAHAASNLRWLQIQGCELTPPGERALAIKKTINPHWNEDWAKSADESYESRGGLVQEVDDPGDLMTRPLRDIANVALERTVRPFKELKSYHPFRGLVQEQPFMALCALRAARREGQFSAQLWSDLLSRWPESSSVRLRYLLAHTIVGLTPDQSADLRYDAPRWLKKHLPELFAHNQEAGLRIFDGFLRPFVRSEPSQTESAVGGTSIGGVEQVRSEVSINKAINSPIGELTEALWGLLPEKARRIGKMDEQLAARFEALASVNGPGAGHAVVVLTQRLGWIEYCYREWMDKFLLPMFQIGHPLAEAAWHGLARNQNGLSVATWNALKKPLLAILRGEVGWSLDPPEREVLAAWLVWLSKSSPKAPALFSFAEIRAVLTKIDNDGRGRVLWVLANALGKGREWKRFIKPFIENAWPRHLRYRSEETTRGFIHIAERSGKDFADVVKTILPFIRPVANADLLTYRISRDRKDNENLANVSPRATLQLLNGITPDDRARVPFELSGALNALADLDPSVKEMPEYRRLAGLLE